MAKEGNADFEIPADMRALAEKSVEQAKQAFDIFISAAQH
ncbi:MAG: phasin, partial [Pseudolabrys sp.]